MQAIEYYLYKIQIDIKLNILFRDTYKCSKIITQIIITKFSKVGSLGEDRLHQL